MAGDSSEVSSRGAGEQESRITGHTSSRDPSHSRFPLALYKKNSHEHDHSRFPSALSTPAHEYEGEDKPAHDLEMKESGTESTPGNGKAESEKVGDERHLNTVVKLKKRSERFKTPMPIPSEKDFTTYKKVESEVLVPSQSEVADAEVKAERPACKRRWISSN